jgi:hypothetical protein
MKNVSCLREPCPRFGQCVEDAKKEALIKLECDPLSNELSDDCAKVHIVFSREKLPVVSNLFYSLKSGLIDAMKVFVVDMLSSYK